MGEKDDCDNENSWISQVDSAVAEGKRREGGGREI